MSKKHFLLLIILFPLLASAQSTYLRQDSIAVLISGNKLDLPWAGGLNEPQFSMIDLNNDGIKDLFLFDRTGNKIRTFLNKGEKGKVSFKYSPEYESKFPDLHQWALLYDFNCDGKEDLFTSTNGGMMVYENSSSGTDLSFKLFTPLLYSKYNFTRTNLYVTGGNLPSFSDVDNDGDMDILTFDLGGNFVELHKNFSQELYGTCDSLIMKFNGGCWGDFSGNSTTNDVTLHAGCKKSGGYQRMAHNVHSGSTVSVFDIDGDKDKDMFVGCICDNNILYLHNGGTDTLAIIDSQTNSFPVNSEAVRVPLFPAAYFLDVDNDSLTDFIAAPNASNVSNSNTGVWFYKNTGTNQIANFMIEEKGFLQNQMIDLGSGCHPALADIDGDQLQDIILGNYGYYTNSGNYIASLAFLKNVGTKTNPSYNWVTRDLDSLSKLALDNIYPSFGDLDKDGDLDMLIGEQEGFLYYFENTASSGQMANFTLKQSKMQGIDVGQFSTPQLVDVDKDGLLDIIIGERSGNLNYYRNTGTPTSPFFTLVSENFGNVDVRQKGFVTGYSNPFLFQDSGSTRLLVGAEKGYLELYSNIDGNFNGTFTRVDSTFGNIYQGNRTSVTGGDINDDGKTDLLIGNFSGGLAIFSITKIITEIQNIPKHHSLKVFPNPVSSTVVISDENEQSKELILFNSLGSKVLQNNFSGKETTLDLSKLESGMYICIIITDQEIFREKIVVSH